MAQTSVNFQSVKAGSEQHNKREKELDYVHKELSHNNEYWESCTQEQRMKELKKLVKDDFCRWRWQDRRLQKEYVQTDGRAGRGEYLGKQTFSTAILLFFCFMGALRKLALPPWRNKG